MDSYFSSQRGSGNLTNPLPPTPVSVKLSLEEDAIEADAVFKIHENVSHVLLAEFDLEKGSVMRCQYPTSPVPPNSDDSFLAENMLPDGVHNRIEDWSVFFLNREGEKFQKRKTKLDPQVLSKEVNYDDHFEESEQKSVRAIVYTMSEQHEWVATHENQSTIVFQAHTGTSGPTAAIFGRFLIKDENNTIFQKIVVMDDLNYIVLSDNYNETGLRFVSMHGHDNKRIGLLIDHESEATLMNWIIDINEVKQAQSPIDVALPFLYCINFIKTKKDSTMRRGASVKALAICSVHPHFFMYKSLLRHAMELIFESGEEPESIVADLYSIINSVDLSATSSLSDTQKRVWRYSIVDKDIVKYQTKVLFRGKSFNLAIPLAIDEDEIGDERASVIKLISKFKQETMLIYNAILEERRVLFVGHNQSAADVCFHVLSACLLVCPPLTGVLKTRVYPYQSLTITGTDFTQVHGYIAGVTNPMFKQRSEMWDLLCDLDTGEVIKNENYASVDSMNQELEMYADDGHQELDEQFLQQIISMVNSHALKGVNHAYSEDSVRSHFQEYTKRIMRMVLGDAIFEDEEMKRNLEYKNMYRLLLLRDVENRSTFKNYLQSRGAQRQKTSIEAIDVEEYITRLRMFQNLQEMEILSIFQDLVRHIRTHEQLLEFLSLLPEAQGGLYPIAVVLFHPSEAVRLSVVAFLRRIDTIKEGSCCISQLNTFLMLTYDRNSRILPHTD